MSHINFKNLLQSSTDELSAPLITSMKEVIFLMFLLIFIFLISIGFEYYDFKKLTSNKVATIQARLINQYQKINKNNKPYFVLKFMSANGFSFVTTSYDALKELRDREFKVVVRTDKMSFLDYLKGTYLPALKIGLLPKGTNYLKIKEFIKSQHQDQKIAELYSALFLATTMSKDLRDNINNWGIAHLVAISGFHAGLISLLVFLILSYPYRFLQSRYFPYRNSFFDLGMISIFVVFIYLWFIDFIPSFLRAFVMMCVGFFLFFRGIRVLNFITLTLAVLLIIAFFPRAIFLLGFWFSVFGVFYIFLFLKYFKLNSKTLLILGLNFWVFIAMMPLVHLFFPLFSLNQLFSPILSIFFGIFYPTSLILHIFGIGYLFDPLLSWFLDIKIDIIKVTTPLWLFVLTLFFSFGSVFDKRLFFGLNAILFGFLGFVLFLSLY